MPLLPKNPSLPDVVAAINAIDVRLAALENDHAALREEIRTRNTAARLEELEGQVIVNTRQRIMNVGAIRAVLTFLHPEENHPEVPPEMTWLHDLVMRWLELYGGRLAPPSFGDEELEDL